jgi:diadenosine tetraphosphate (Ap4A) HIT family hydrolase
MKKCDFCNLSTFEKRIYYQSKFFYWILDRSPIRPGHTLVIPKRHLKSFEDLQTKEIKALVGEAKRWVPKILKTYKATGYNLVANISKAAGQSVPHLHFHIIPRTRAELGKLDKVRQIYYRSLPEHKRPRIIVHQVIQQVNKLKLK